MKREHSNLSLEEVHAVLARNQIGRIAYSRGTSIDIEPLVYVYSEGWLYGRTSAKRRLAAAGDGWWPVAFEVDEIDGIFDWRSVAVHGGFYTLSENGSEWERSERSRAIELLRRLVPATFTTDDPTPELDVIFRIAVQEVSGRASSTRETSVAALPALVAV